ncbi:uncharacterized protein LOC129579202 [Sitodiplosis mosellana]|uniref:uncharacterized protein LOC129579202 n=1 Tax=Sitodiplosis mosellana TaxID=263140 RepID=UPI002443D297|nr:uncharacterized protein LOC129579202 [Sitodiplosis mosellana]
MSRGFISNVVVVHFEALNALSAFDKNCQMILYTCEYLRETKTNTPLNCLRIRCAAMNYRNLQTEFRSLGCSDEAQSIAACQLYIELCEVRRKLNVKYYYNAEINKIYLTATNEVGAIESVYLPIPTSATVDLTANEPIFKALFAAHVHEISDPETVQLIFAFVDPTTTIAYYKLTLGMLSLNAMKIKRRSKIPKDEPQTTAS